MRHFGGGFFSIAVHMGSEIQVGTLTSVAA